MIERADGLVELIEEYFFEIVDTGLLNLEEDERFKGIKEEKEKLFMDYPNLAKVVLYEDALELNKKDLEGLKQLLGINQSISMLEMQYCYYKGMKDYANLLKTINSK